MLPSDTPPVISTLKSNNVSKHLNKSKSESKLDRTLSLPEVVRDVIFIFLNFFYNHIHRKKKSVYIYDSPPSSFVRGDQRIKLRV